MFNFFKKLKQRYLYAKTMMQVTEENKKRRAQASPEENDAIDAEMAAYRAQLEAKLTNMKDKKKN